MTTTQQFILVVAVMCAGAAAGEAIRRWLQDLTYRRPADTRPPPGPRWWAPPVLAAAFAGLAWRVFLQPPPALVNQTEYSWIGSPALVQSVVLLTLFGVFAMCVAAAAIDLDVHRLPDKLTGAAFTMAVTGWVLVSLMTGSGWPLVRALACGLTFGSFYLVLAVLSSRGGRTGLGLGDIKLAVALGATLGWFGIQPAFIGLYAGILLGALCAAARIVVDKPERSSHFAYGPPLLAGAYMGVTAGSCLFQFV